MKKIIFTLLILLTFVSACTTTAVEPADPTATLPTNTNTPQPTSTPTPIPPTATVTPTPPPTPTPIGGSKNPILAMSMGSSVYQSYIIISDLFTKKEITRIPIIKPGEALSLSPNGEYLAFVDIRENEKGIYLHNLLTQETKLLYSQPDKTAIYKLRWSPDQQWLAFEMESGVTRSIQLWVVNISSGSTRFISGGDEIDWLNSGELYYQKSGGVNYHLNLSTRESVLVNYKFVGLAPIKARVEVDLAGMSALYIPHLEGYLLETTERDNPESPHYFLFNRNEEQPPGTFLAKITTDTRMRYWELLYSPNKKVWVFCVNKGEGVHYYGNGLPDGRFFTSWAIQEELPITDETITVEDFQPLKWAPDGNSILGLSYIPDPNVENLSKISGIQILDINSGDLIYDFKFPNIENLTPNIRLSDHRPRSFDVLWTEDLTDLSDVVYIPPTLTPTPTLDPNANPIEPVLERVTNLTLTNQLNLETSFNQNHWEFENVELSSGGNLLLEPNSTGGKLYYAQEALGSGQGVLLKFKISSSAKMTIALTKGVWQKDSFRFWGLSGGGDRLHSLVMKGSSGFPADFQGEVDVYPDGWYYLFLGVSGEDELFQIFWNENNPTIIKVGYVDFESSDEEGYHLWFGDAGAGRGILELGLVELYRFDNFVGN